MKFAIINQQTPVLQDDGTFAQEWYLFFNNVFKNIRAAFGIALGGLVQSSIDPKGNTSTGATDLISLNVERNTFTDNGFFLEIEACGYYAANANNKTIQLYFGSEVIFTSGAIAANNTAWSIKAKIFRTGNSAQEVIVDGICNNTAFCQRKATTQNSNDQINVKCVGTGGATNDLTQTAMIIKLTPNT